MEPNEIDSVRAEIQRYFSESSLIDQEMEIELAPDGMHAIRKHYYKQSKPGTNWTVAKIEIVDQQEQRIASVILDDARFFHLWASIKGTAYLFFAENLCGGNSLLNLETKALLSYADGTDGFICADYQPSPSQDLMASMGCYWACPYVIRIFDIRNVETLPWPVVQDIELLDEETEIRWVGDGAIELLAMRDGSLQVNRRVTLATAV
jgi:hypothetical protein